MLLFSWKTSYNSPQLAFLALSPVRYLVLLVFEDYLSRCMLSLLNFLWKLKTNPLFCFLQFLLWIFLLSFLINKLLKGKKLLGLIVQRIIQQILIDLINRSLNTMSTTLTRSNINNLSQPISGSIIDSLSNIKPKIKSTMIGTTKNSNNFMLFVFSFSYSQSRIFFLQIVRTNQTSFMSQKLFAWTKMFRKQSLSLSLYYLLVLTTNSVPKFRFALMNKVDPR